MLCKAGMLVFLCASVSCAESPMGECFVDFPVYDPSGTRIPFRVVRVSPAGRSDIDLLKNSPTVLTSRDSRVIFGRSLVGRHMKVVLESPAGDRLSTEVAITDCRMRRSLAYGSSDIGRDVSGIRVSGRLVGCSFVGDWWVRATPQHGGHDGTYATDGRVETDGGFDLSLAALGVRHLLIIGKAQDPIRVLAFNVIVGMQHDLGNVDIGRDCPDE